ncbi:MAG: hypothetical protein ACRDBO_00120 [Lachnospiraceae bacterium]
MNFNQNNRKGDCMMFYAIKRKRGGKQFVTGTDYRYNPPRQICNPCLPPLILSDYDGQIQSLVDTALASRHVNLKYYELVSVEVKEMQFEQEIK